jgi:hypothetical protein
MTATTPLAATCTRCGAYVLEVRWDFHQDVLIGAPLLDPVSLDRQQVLACVITGVPLWQVDTRGDRTITSHRTRFWPRHPVPGHIAPEHRCGHQWDAFPLELAPDPTTIPELCPF